MRRQDGLGSLLTDDEGDDGARQVAGEGYARLGRGVILARDGRGAFHLDIAGRGGRGDVLADLDVLDVQVGHCCCRVARARQGCDLSQFGEVSNRVAIDAQVEYARNWRWGTRCAKIASVE